MSDEEIASRTGGNALGIVGPFTEKKMWYLGLVVRKIVRKTYNTSVVAGRPYLESKIAHGSLGPLIVEFY